MASGKHLPPVVEPTRNDNPPARIQTSNSTSSSEPVKLELNGVEHEQIPQEESNIVTPAVVASHDPRRRSSHIATAGALSQPEHNAELDEESDAVSDDENFDEEGYSNTHSKPLGFGDLDKRSRFLLENADVLGPIREQARRPFLQRQRYIQVLEEKVVDLLTNQEFLKDEKHALEEKLKLYDGPTDVVESDLEVAPMDATPDHLIQVARRTWSEWFYHANSPAPWMVVELLVEKPQSLSNFEVPWVLRRRFRKLNAPTASENNKDIERVRINSPHLVDVFKSMLGEATAPPNGSVHVRPFKLLVCYEKELRMILSDLRRQLEINHNNETLRLAHGPVDTTGAQEGRTTSSNAPTSSREQDSHSSKQSAATETQLTASEVMVEHLEFLLEVLNGELGNYQTIHRLLRARNAEKVAFKDLWHLFAPGDKIYEAWTKQAYQVVAVQGGRPLLTKKLATAEFGPEEAPFGPQAPALEQDIISPFIIDCYYMDFNGEELGSVGHRFRIMPYDGDHLIQSLQVFPLEYAKGKLAEPNNSSNISMEAHLIERGEKFLQFTDSKEVAHREYVGFSADNTREQIDSRVIIDLSLYWEKNINRRPSLGLNEPEEADRREVTEMIPDLGIANTCNCSSCVSKKNATPGKIYDDNKLDRQRMQAFISESSDALRAVRNPKGKLTLDQLSLLPSKAYGYVLRSRKWHALDVDKIMPVQQRAQNFHDLILPDDHKKLVEGMVRTHARGIKPSSSPSDEKYGTDLVRGKGKGIIILLHGVPGVGKTSTAECVAEYTLRPLFSVTCGDIGEDARTVEDSLEESFQLAHRWGCVMLLDEADVFLQTRNKNDMKRNAVVSVFLRILEYYSGILFLTTNKVGTFDEAFKSRIHLSLYYPPLDIDQTMAIWDVNLKRIELNHPSLDVEHERIMEWVDELVDKVERHDLRPWNGRQIHNACQTAASIAQFQAQQQQQTTEDKEQGLTINVSRTRSRLGPKQFDMVAAATMEFDDYLREVHGTDDAGRAKRAGDRHDDFWEPEEENEFRRHYDRPPPAGRRRDVRRDRRTIPAFQAPPRRGGSGRGRGRVRDSNEWYSDEYGKRSRGALAEDDGDDDLDVERDSYRTVRTAAQDRTSRRPREMDDSRTLR